MLLFLNRTEEFIRAISPQNRSVTNSKNSHIHIPYSSPTQYQRSIKIQRSPFQMQMHVYKALRCHRPNDTNSPTNRHSSHLKTSENGNARNFSRAKWQQFIPSPTFFPAESIITDPTMRSMSARRFGAFGFRIRVWGYT